MSTEIAVDRVFRRTDELPAAEDEDAERRASPGHAIMGALLLGPAVAQPERIQLDDLRNWRADL